LAEADMVGKHISAVNIRAVYIARNPKGSSPRRREWLPDPTQGHRLSPENASAVACPGAGSMASHFDSGKLAFHLRLKSQVFSEDL
jgi:hypothetical protein